MHKLYTLIIALFAFGFGMTQTASNPITWSFTAKKKSTNTYELIATATVVKPWHIYSQNTRDGGPLPTKFTFNNNPLVTLVGKTNETGKLDKVYDKNFKIDVLYYSNNVVFTQIVKVKTGLKTNITGNVNYMLCDDEKCLAPTKKTFDIKLQ